MAIHANGSAEMGYLTTPPEGVGSAPTTTRPQVLPLASLTPQDFERLCFRLTRVHAAVERCRPYGVTGQAQHGIDLYARRTDGTYFVVQCKRRTDQFTVGEMTAAVDKFLDGDWAEKADEFVLALTASLDRTECGEAIETEARRLDARGVKLTIWDETEISSLLKDHPTLVDDFFGRAAVSVFLGNGTSDSLANRLDAGEVVAYRDKLGRLYREIFQRVERGVHGDDRNTPRDARFVMPDVLLTDTSRRVSVSVDQDRREAGRDSSAPTIDPILGRHGRDVIRMLRNPTLISGPAPPAAVPHAGRVPAADWLQTGSHHVLIGAPGSGKSAFLRMTVLDVLGSQPVFVGNVDRLQGLLPVWLPFAFWTNLARTRGEAVSVLSAVEAWLKAYDHAHLLPLVERALQDQRVLLVIDGLDEWASPDLARSCAERLEVFASTKQVQILASSRPFSVTDLALDPTQWRISELAALDPAQRLEFTRKWLTPLIGEPAARTEAEVWTAEIDSSHHLRELADLPLFLLLLLRSREQQAAFPEDLYAVLSDAVDRLIGEHRRRKIDTSGAADSFPSPGDIRKLSAAAAEHMHLRSVVSLSDDDLRNVFREALTTTVGYPHSDAHALAVALVNSLSPGVGLMVRPAPDENVFFHRSILEFLVGERLLARPSEQHVDLFRDHLADPRWSQVLRFLTRGLVRPAEIAAIFDGLDGCTDPLLREATMLLAAEVAVGGGHVDAVTRQRLLERAVKEIETGERDGHRAALLDRLAAGLSRPEIRGQLDARFRAWLLGLSSISWSWVLQAAATWPPDTALLALLWHAVLSDDDKIQRVAARVLGNRFGGDEPCADRLAALATSTRLHSRRAAATEALSVGWPHDPRLDDLIASGREHYDFAVRHASVAADLRRGHHTEANRAILIGLLDHPPRMSAWSDGLVELMLEHYADDDEIYHHYIAALEPSHGSFRRDEGPATRVILEGYIRRPAARQYLLHLLDPESNVLPDSIVDDYVPWERVAATYSEDAEVVQAVEERARRRATTSIGDRDIYFCSLVARTNWMRDQLIDRLERRHDFGLGWAIRALSEGWETDQKAQAALARVVDPTYGPVPESALWRLADIISDPLLSLERLAQLAAGMSDQSLVIHTLGEIIRRGAPPDDGRAAAIVDRALDADFANPWSSPEAALYREFGHDPRVRELAWARLHERDAPIWAMAAGLRDDGDIRQLISTYVRPLSAPMRGRLIEAIAAGPTTDREATGFLAAYDAESDGVVKILAATSYARRLVDTGHVTEDFVGVVTEQARALGHDHYERRAAAFCVLAELGRLDRLVDLRDRVTPDEPVQIQYSAFDDTGIFFRHVCRHWRDIKATFGDHFPSRFGFRDNDDAFWRHVLTVAADYPVTREDIATKLAHADDLVRSVEGVAYLARTEPGSDRLFDACVSLLKPERANGSYAGDAPGWTALEVIGEQFADDPRLNAWLDDELRQLSTAREHLGEVLPSLGTTAALARHRSTEPLIHELARTTARPHDGPWYQFREWTELAAATTQDVDAFISLAREAAIVVLNNDMFPEYLHRPLTARLRRDGSLATAVARKVPALSEPDAGLAIRLLALSGRIDGALLQHLRAHLAANDNERAAATIDAISGRVRHKQLLLLDVLDVGAAPG